MPNRKSKVKNQQAIISLGSNLGNRLELLQKALILIENQLIKVDALSSLYESPAWGFEGSPFYNACAKIKTDLNPVELLKVFLQIEEKLGRFRGTKQGYAARQIDLDLLFYDDFVFSSDYLTLPHPRLQLRNFVLVPLEEIVPKWEHPVFKKTISQLLKQSPDQDRLKKLPFQKWSPPIFDAFPYIVIEGNIGVGKTTLAQKIASNYQLPLLPETFAKNPYLEKFYTDPFSYSLVLEQFFLKDRIEQTSAFWNQNKDKAISDYNIQKSLIFARQNLNDLDFNVFKEHFDQLYSRHKLPDLMVYLHTDIKTLQAQIINRGRPYEQKIKKEYLEQIESGYQKLIQSELSYPVVSISTKNLDFKTNPTNYQTLLRLIFQASF